MTNVMRSRRELNLAKKERDTTKKALTNKLKDLAKAREKALRTQKVLFEKAVKTAAQAACDYRALHAHYMHCQNMNLFDLGTKLTNMRLNKKAMPSQHAKVAPAPAVESLPQTLRNRREP